MFCCCYGSGPSRRGLIIVTVPWNERARATAQRGELKDDHPNFMLWSQQAGNEGMQCMSRRRGCMSRRRGCIPVPRQNFEISSQKHSKI